MAGLHEMITLVRAPACALCGVDGNLTHGAHGVFVNDRRVVSRWQLTVGDGPTTGLGAELIGSDTARFVTVLDALGDSGADPTVWLDRRRELRPDGVRDTATVVSRARAPVTCTVRLELVGDLAELAEVRGGGSRPVVPSVRRVAGATWQSVQASLSPPADEVDDAGWRWEIVVSPGQVWTLTVDVTVSDAPGVIVAPTRPTFAAPEVDSADVRLGRLVEQSVADLHGLLAGDPEANADTFLTAGAPWYLTLFGRDSLWAARMLLPLGTELAGGTLRTLARRQGRRTDPATEEQPGKIMHELRRTPTTHGLAGHSHHPLTLPPLYYGTVDATPLWISLLHDAWLWGLPAAEIVELLPALEAALGWLADAVDESGFIRYVDTSGHGLANQGWKDSADAVQFADGTLAEPPIALCEVQGYAHLAAVQGAALLEAFGRPGASAWRSWAASLADRFRARFWVEDARGRYPAIALDGSGRRANTVTSNIGHLLGTGLLDDDETALVVDRLGHPDLDCGFGLRTMSSDAAGFNPLSYHCGSVWPHDTAIAIYGLAAVGTPAAQDVAARLIGGLLRAAEAFAYRLPELYGGEADVPAPLPYPAACRPQAWSAASAVVLLAVATGASPDAVRPLVASPVGELAVRGFVAGGRQ